MSNLVKGNTFMMMMPLQDFTAVKVYNPGDHSSPYSPLYLKNYDAENTQLNKNFRSKTSV